MPRYKKTASHLKDPSCFQSYYAEEKYEEFIKSRKILEEKGFNFQNNSPELCKHYIMLQQSVDG